MSIVSKPKDSRKSKYLPSLNTQLFKKIGSFLFNEQASDELSNERLTQVDEVSPSRPETEIEVVDSELDVDSEEEKKVTIQEAILSIDSLKLFASQRVDKKLNVDLARLLNRIQKMILADRSGPFF